MASTAAISAVAENGPVLHVIQGCKMAATNSLVQTRINAVIKAEAPAVLETIGLTVSDAVCLMLTRVAHEKALLFEPRIPNATTVAAKNEAKAGKLEKVALDDLQAARCAPLPAH
jgi:DNA-damage-inducible protein J